MVTSTTTTSSTTSSSKTSVYTSSGLIPTSNLNNNQLSPSPTFFRTRVEHQLAFYEQQQFEYSFDSRKAPPIQKVLLEKKPSNNKITTMQNKYLDHLINNVTFQKVEKYLFSNYCPN